MSFSLIIDILDNSTIGWMRYDLRIDFVFEPVRYGDHMISRTTVEIISSVLCGIPSMRFQ